MDLLELIYSFIAIGIGMFLIKLWWVKLLGALYLAWLSVKYFIDKRKGAGEERSSWYEPKQYFLQNVRCLLGNSCNGRINGYRILCR